MRRMRAFGWVTAAVLCAGAVASAQSWQIGPFTRPAEGNPVVKPNKDSSFADPLLKAPSHWEALHTFNPAAIVRDGKVVVLYRAEDDSGKMEIGMHTSRLGMAESEDGIHFTRHPAPVFFAAKDNQKAREWPGGVEDPRLVESEDGSYVLTYTQWNRRVAHLAVATSKDLTHWTKYGPAFKDALGGKYAARWSKSAGIVTRLDEAKGRLIATKIDGKYWMYWGEGTVYLATSTDLIHWTPVEDAKGELLVLLAPRTGRFDSSFPEGGPPPVLTKDGIVLIYNGRNAEKDGDPKMGAFAYAAGEALFDAHEPSRMLARTDEPVLKPELAYEKTGQYVAGTTFSEGLVYFKGQWMIYYGCADSLVSVAMAPSRPAAQGFALKNGDTVVFYGDSITAQSLYTQWVELYTATRFPTMRVHFYGEGVGGDKVTGGSGGTVDERLARDVFPHKPTVVTVMLGMNDGSYRPLTSETESAYTKGYERLLESIHEHAPAARVTLLGPSPFDEVTRTPDIEGGYNNVMLHFGEVDRELAGRFGAGYVNLNPPVVEALKRAQAVDPQVARLLLPDRVHPETIAHWAMAGAVLKGWNAPALVAAVAIDGKAGKLAETENAVVEGVTRNKDGLHWRAEEFGLPLPLNAHNEMQALLFKFTDLKQQLDQEPLRVTGLEAGRYKLTIDDTVTGIFTAAELEKGINLADYQTPMFHQAQWVSWLIGDRTEAHRVHMQMLIRKAEMGAPDAVDAFENGLEDSIYEAAAPKAHAFTLSPVADAAK